MFPMFVFTFGFHDALRSRNVKRTKHSYCAQHENVAEMFSLIDF